MLPKRPEIFSARANVGCQTAILCVYEFLSATGAAWSRHLNGTKSLLVIAEGGMMPLGELSVPPSKARRATFWNFARQDYLAACKSSALIFSLTEIIILIMPSHKRMPDTP